MKLQFKHQKFQADAAKAVVDVFAGQPYLTPTYMMDRGLEDGEQQAIATMDDFTGWRNERIVPELSDKLILEHLQKVQRTNQIKPSDTDIFTEPTIKGKLGTNAMKAQRHLYDHIVYDSTNERDFATDLDTNADVAVYVKLPDSFYIATPVGHYNPDWAIAFYEGTVKHIYFVAETKGSMSSMQLRLIEESKIHCAREHFKAISNGNVVYDVVDSYQTLLEKVMR